MTRRSIYAFGLVGALMLPTPGQAQSADNEGTSVPICLAGSPDARPEDTDARRLSSTIGIKNCWKANTANDSQYYLNDLYSRWTIEEVDQPRLLLRRDYKSEHRGLFGRMFVGKTRGSVVSIKIKMRDPDVEFTLPIMSVDYNGKSGQGEVFSTSFVSSDMGLPDFRMTPNTSVSVEATARNTKDVDVQSTGLVLGAIKDALSLVAPGGSLLTAINREQLQKVSTAYDTALSKLLSSAVSESTSVGRLMSEWYPRSAILISIDVPEDIRTGSLGDAPATRRVWFSLSMTCPRISVFDTTNVCSTSPDLTRNLRTVINSPYRDDGPHGNENAPGSPGFNGPAYAMAVRELRYRLSASQVLNFKVGANKSVRQFLTEQEWFISLSKKMVQPSNDVVKAVEAVDIATDKPKGTDQQKALDTAASAEFCDAVVEKLFSAGLNRLDSEIGLWAVASGMPDFASARPLFQASDGCKAHLPDGGEGGWRYARKSPS
jgi:hypothetical protein